VNPEQFGEKRNFMLNSSIDGCLGFYGTFNKFKSYRTFTAALKWCIKMRFLDHIAHSHMIKTSKCNKILANMYKPVIFISTVRAKNISLYCYFSNHITNTDT